MPRDSFTKNACLAVGLVLAGAAIWPLPGGAAGAGPDAASAVFVVSGDVTAKKAAVEQALEGMAPEMRVLSENSFGPTPYEEVRVTVRVPPCDRCADEREHAAAVILTAIGSTSVAERVVVKPG